jgi:polysaccharide biosynthesis protein PelF
MTASAAAHGLTGPRIVEPTRRPIRVLLLTEGTYPFRWGGVSTWCHALTHELSDVRFSLLAIAEAPRLERRFELASNVERFRAVSLWGVRDAWEVRDEETDARLVRRRLRRTTTRAIERECIPHFRRVVASLLGEDIEPEALALTLHQLHWFFVTHDYDATLRSLPVWECFTNEVSDRFGSLAARHGYDEAHASLADVTTTFQWVHHWLFPLAEPLPKVDVVHATMAGICTVVGAVAKIDHGAGFLLSEHGIYLRESYLAEQASEDSLFRKLFRLRFARMATELGYGLADRVAPCCDYNRRWEVRVGVDPERVATAYYGLDPAGFPAPARREPDAPVVVWAGRIDPLKDVETLLQAAANVSEVRPEVRFRLFGSAPPGNEEYLDRCLRVHDELGLHGTVTFEGFASRTADAFADSDVVVLSSISEGFPYSTLEAMFCGRPIVATAVGGLAEQLGGAGLLVRPRDPAALAEAILTLVSDRALRRRLGRAAKERAESNFTLERFRRVHGEVYEALAPSYAQEAAA